MKTPDEVTAADLAQVDQANAALDALVKLVRDHNQHCPHANAPVPCFGTGAWKAVDRMPWGQMANTLALAMNRLARQ